MRLKLSRFLFPALLVLATLTAYFPAIRWAGFVWDDDVHLTKNPVIFAANGLAAIWSETTWRVQFYPLTFTSFWLQYHLNGLDPLPYHLLNVLLHAANALLIWQLLRRLGVRSAILVAALFALHPINVESVAWVTERKNVLMVFFYLLAALAYWRFEGKFENPAQPRHWRFYLLATLAFLASLLCKTVSCTFPAAMAVILWWKRGKLTLRDLLPLIPWLVIGLGIAGWTAYLEKAVVGSVGDAWNYTRIERVLIAGRAVWFYAGTFLWPSNLTFSYPLWTIHGAPWWSYAAPISVAVVIATLWMLRKKLGRGPLAAWLFFLVTISPALSFVDYYTMIYSLVADHYVYLAMVGFALLLLEPFTYLHWASNRGRSVMLGILGGILFLMACLTWQRSLAYENPETLWQDTVEKNPASWMARIGLGIELRRKGHLDDALAQFQKALLINPHAYQAINDMGSLFSDRGRLSEAEACFLQVLHENPAMATAYSNMGTVRFLQHRLPEAEEFYNRAIGLDPYNSEARLHLGYLLAGEHRFAAAADFFGQVVKLDPSNAAAHLNRGECLAELGRLTEALGEFEEAVRLRPGWKVAEEDVMRARTFLSRAPRR